MLWIRTGCALAALLCAAVAQAPLTVPAVAQADLRRHVETLASDALQGRSTGSPEAMEAARYLAAELKRFGVEPAGEGGTYFQRVPMGRTEFLEIPEFVCLDASGVRLPSTAGIDFDLSDGGCDLRELRVVYATSPESIPREPDAKAALAVLAGSATQRVAWLKAAGIPDGAGWGLLITLGMEQPGSRAMERPPRPRARSAPPTPRIAVRGALRKAFLEQQVAGVTFRAKIRSVELEAVNVAGKITGAGTPEQPAIAAEVFEFSAHYDHLPPRPVESGQDGIFNGADDDASGCAVVLELAEAFAHGPKPARTLLFFFATGEEIGLVGTNYSLDHPLVPLESIVLDVNFEMLGRPDPKLVAPARMWLTGFERSDLGGELARLGVPVVPDLRPEQNFFQRSDNYALALRGIVAQTLSSYGMHTDYHKVTDDPSTIDFAHLEACAAGAYAGCRAIADGTFRPRWREGQDPSKQKSRGAEPKQPAGDPEPKRPAGG
jgi:hypothetical protein